MWRPSLSPLLAAALALCGGLPAAGFEGSLLPATAGQLALLAAFAGPGYADDAEDAEGGKGEEAEDMHDGEEEDGEHEHVFDHNEIMDDLDQNKDGFLTFEDFIRPGSDPTDDDKEQLKKIIKKADADGDGKISKEEIPALLKAFDRETQSEL
mmetsp:Transcript_17379/g.54634  ORF Transcript_17379/g.54634 Transcript_17379/m.54634 type:complete len:153 (+) Transcript_17379:48-506(+)